MRTDPERLRELVFEPRWAAVSKLDVDARTVATWDGDLVRDVRLLVPIDVQALTVGSDGPSADEAMVRLPSPVNDPTGQGTGFPAPFTDGQPRPAGVHLHWAMPDALLRGRLAEGTGDNRLDLPPLPDRWVVLRALLPDGADVADVRGWVLEADRAVRVQLDEWPDAAPQATPSGAPLAAEALTGTAGGAVTWAATYDSVVDRFSFHDPLDDVDPAAGAGPAGATYIVAGWWSKAGLDPLDRVQDQASLDALLHELGWSAVAPWVDAPGDQRRRDEVARLRTSVALTSGTSFKVRSAEAPAPVSHVTKQALVPATQAVRTDLVVAGDKVLTGKAWWPHATLLHGSVYGVPVLGDVGRPAVDNRPDAGGVTVALGLSDDDVLAALTAPALGPSTPDGRRATERLLGAFTSHSLRELGRPDGVATVEEHEHAIAFGSLPGGSRGDDRLLAGRSGTARRVGRGARAAAKGGAKGVAGADVATRLSKLFLDRKQLLRADEVRAVVSAQSGAAEPAIDTEPRVVARPAPRYHFPLDPLVAVQGAGRSLRHGGDGRVSPDGLLWCRWPHQVIREIKGVARGADVVPTLGNGALPPEVLGLVQEAVLHSPYARRWVADRSASRSGLPAAAVRRRLDAEAGLRFGARAVYDGATQALAGKGASVADRLSVADELWRHSLLVGVDPSPVGVTAWSQPWVPLWLEWEAETELATTVAGWVLDAVDAEPDPDVALPTPTTRLHRGVAPRADRRTSAPSRGSLVRGDDSPPSLPYLDPRPASSRA